MSPSEAAWHALRPTQRLLLRQLPRRPRSSFVSTYRWPPTSSPQPSPRSIPSPATTRRLYSTVPPNSSRDDPRHNETSLPQAQQAPTTASHPELPSAAESRRSPLATKFSTFMDTMQSRVLVASQTLNDLTGYTAIEAIKAQNASLETELAAAQATLRSARQTYKDVNASRASTQREVTALLARKDSWTPADLERFTALYRTDHELEAGVAAAAAALTDAEADEARLAAALMAGMLRRYHEEQVWSDRIRRQSTWGTWALMGVNVLLFLVLQFLAEPWKRARLMRGVAEAERGVLDEVRRELESVREALVASEKAAREEGAIVQPGAATATAAPEVVLSSPPRTAWRDVCRDPKLWKPALLDLYSERRLDLRMRDATLIALEGALAGATIAAGIALVSLRRT